MPRDKLNLFRKLRRFAMPQNHDDEAKESELAVAADADGAHSQSAKAAQCSLSFEIDNANQRTLIHSDNVGRCNNLSKRIVCGWNVIDL